MSAASDYQRHRDTFEFLETVAELSDQVELDADREGLMRCPTKARAAEMYERAIVLWFGEHGAAFEDAVDIQDIAHEYGL